MKVPDGVHEKRKKEKSCWCRRRKFDRFRNTTQYCEIVLCGKGVTHFFELFEIVRYFWTKQLRGQQKHSGTKIVSKRAYVFLLNIGCGDHTAKFGHRFCVVGRNILEQKVCTCVLCKTTVDRNK